MNKYEEIYTVVRKIPKGKVATYGSVAKLLITAFKKTPGFQPGDELNSDMSSSFRGNPALKSGEDVIANGISVTPRLIGRALHNNPDPQNIPCHRVVDRNGRIAESFAFGGARKQRKRLLEEGVKFKDSMHVDLEKCLWKLT